MDLDLDELKRRAKTGDLKALQQLRDSGYFQQKQPQPNGYALSPGQRRLWVLHQMDGASAAYNVPFVLQLDGALDTAVFAHALHSLAHRHDSLRTHFALVEGQPRQFVQEQVTFPLKIVDLRQEPEPLKTAVQLAQRHARTQFDLTQFPLYRAELLQTADSQHIFLFNIHHILADGWSAELLMHELAAFYTATSRHQPNPLPPLSQQYHHYAAAQNRYLHSPQGQADGVYWQGKLGGRLPLLNLPTDHPRPPLLTFTGEMVSTTFGSEETAVLHQFARQHSATLFMSLVAWMKLLLHRYTSQTDILIGTPIAGREGAAWQHIVGFLVNTLVLRDTVLGEENFGQLLERVRETAVSAYAHQQYPFDQLVDDLALPRDMSRNPIFDVLIQLDHAQNSPVSLGDVHLSTMDAGFIAAKFDLTFDFVETADSLHLHLTYNTSLYSRPRMERLLAHLHTLLASLAAQPTLPINQLNMLPDAEKAQLAAWNNTATSYPAEATIPSLFVEMVQKFGEKTAVIASDASLTYQQLHQQAQHIAAHLIAQGLQPGDRVALLLPRDHHMIIAILGALYAGGIYVPLDPAYPPDRLAHMLTDSGSRILIHDLRLTIDDLLSTSHISRFTLHVSRLPIQSLLHPPPPNLHSPISIPPTSPAYLLYTSGSTGKPKGVLVTHRNVVRLLKNDNHPFDFTENDVWVVAHSFCFDFSVWEMYGALLNGGAVVVAERDTVRDPVTFLALLRQHRITVLNQTPAAFYNLLAHEQTGGTPGLHRHLRCVIFGGDRLDPTYLRPWVSRYPLHQIRLVNMYGITETTVHVTHHILTEQDVWGEGGRSPIGVPIPETQVYILNEARQQQPIGIPGEIYVGGSGVSAGYWERPNLTAERFIQYSVLSIQYSVFSEEKLGTDNWVLGTVYRSGDLGRWLPDGTLEHLGRNDFQVQLRGFRIELGEIESVLLAQAGVARAVVIARGEDAAKQLIAYLIPTQKETTEGLIAHLRQAIQATLPEYMMPGAFVLLDHFPLTSNSKVDRDALPQPIRQPDQLVAPRTATESRLTAIWQTVLEQPHLGVHDDFFALGGHSLLATRVVAQIQAEMGVAVGLRDLFVRPTVAQLAEWIETLGKTAVSAIPPIPPADHYPVSHAQRRLWVIEKMGVGRAAYNIPAAIWLAGQVDTAALETALQQLVARHEALRTGFVELDGEPRQVVYPQLPWQIHRVAVASPDQLNEQIHAEAAQPFDLTSPPLFRFTLFQVAGRSLLMLTIHHIISDGWSLERLLDETMRLLQGETLPPLPIQYKEYAAWQQTFLQGEQARENGRFWQTALNGELPLLDLPTDFPRPAVQTFAGAEVSETWSLTESQAMLRLGQEAKATPFMIVLALVNGLLHRYTSQEEIILGYPTAGRDHPDLLAQVGFYVNMLPLRQRINGEASLLELLAVVRQTVTAAFDHQMYPFDLLVEELKVRRDMGRSPLFDVAVSLQTVDGKQGLSTAVYDLKPGISKWDMTFFFQLLPDGRLHLNIEYSTDLFASDRMERLLAHLRQLAYSATQTPHLPLNQLNILSPAEQQLLASFNDTKRPYPADQTIPALFAAQVARTPENTAVQFNTTRLTYAALNQQANRLAHTLRQVYAIQPEEPVGVLLDRSEWIPVALLGILKAGGAYLPIDPAAPRTRVAHMLQDANCRLVLSEPKHLAGLPQAADIQALLGNDESDLPLVGNGRSLAYIIYTSGSTGQPKGSFIEHRSVLRLVLNTNYIQLNEESRILQTGSLAFDASTFEIWGALLNGGTLCLPGGEALLEAAALRQLIRQHRANIIFLTTSLFNQFVEADVFLFSGLKTILSGGEKVSVGHFNRLRAALPEIDLLHVYGPTENTTFSTYYPVRQTQQSDVPIGYPLANSTVHILDTKGQPVPIGIPGEIYVGGDGVARGYLNRPDLTAERFVLGDTVQYSVLSTQYSVGKSLGTGYLLLGTVYRTGDLGCWLPDGSVRFIGRIDNQVKVRGFRVEPGEIEQCLLGYGGVQETAVIPRTTTVGTKELIAYVVGERPLTAQELRAHLGQTLPEYMIPTHFVQLPNFPLNQSGKINRAALPEPEFGPNQQYAPPRNGQEEVLVDVWQQVLGLPQVGIHDNYFEVGGDSIRAIQITSRLLKQGWKLEIQQLFLLPTIAELSATLQPAAEPSPPQQVVGDVPLTAVQRWFFAEHTIELAHFNQAVLLRSHQPLDEAALQQTLAALFAHHDMLRAVYRDGKQQILPQMAIDLRVVDDWNAKGFAFRTAHQGFDLEKGPLFKALLLRQADGDHLLLVGHHLIVDGVSWRILLEDLAQGYAQVLAGQTVELGPKTASFQQWANGVVGYAQSGTWAATEPYWTAVSHQSLSLEQPVDTVYGDAETAVITLTPADTEALLRRTHHAYHTEMNDILLTALACALQGWNGRSQTFITLEGHGRDGLPDLDVSRTVGWFTTLYPFLLTLPEQETGAQIKGMKERLRQIPGKGFDYGVLRYVVGRPWQIRPFLSFNYLGQFDESADGFFTFADESSGTAISPRQQRQHELDVSGLIAQGQLMLSVTYPAERYKRPFVEQLLQGYKQALLEIIHHCQQQTEGEKTVSDFTADLSEEELAAILGL